jgi:hypothetical protein
MTVIEIKDLDPTGLASFFVQSRAYQMSVTLPARVPALPLWTRIVSALATWMATVWLKSIHRMWVPATLVDPWVMAGGIPDTDSKPTHWMTKLGICCKLT